MILNCTFTHKVIHLSFLHFFFKKKKATKGGDGDLTNNKKQSLQYEKLRLNITLFGKGRGIGSESWK